MKTADTPLRVTRTDVGVAFWIHVTPRARRSVVGGVHGEALRVSVSEPPVDGEANRGCVRALAKALEVSRADVTLELASRARRKRVRVDGDPLALSARLRGLAGAGRSD